MQIKSKYKLARRLGAFLFEKTQTAKYAVRAEKKAKNSKSSRPRSRTDYAVQILEKQRARFLYGISEKQFSKYVQQSLAKHANNQDEILYQRLETRLDNVAYRLGLAPTRQASRQMVSHGHIVVNGKKTTIPSYELHLGDEITIREGSKNKAIFINLDEKLKEVVIPSWLKIDISKKVATVQGLPKLITTEVPFDLSLILEFYKR